MIVQVAQCDINAGIRKVCYACPIALAIFREYGLRASVGSLMIVVENKQYAVPIDVAQFIVNFDLGYPIAPFTFELK